MLRKLLLLWSKVGKQINSLAYRIISVIFGITLFLALGISASNSANPSSSIQFVSPSWVQEHLSDPKLRILDVRINPLEYIDGHLPQAVNIADNNFRGPNGFLPVQYWETAKIGSLLSKAGVSNNNKVLVYSDGNNVLGATMVAYLLERSGAKDIAVLDGGFKGYKDAKENVTKEFPRYKNGNFTLKDNENIRISLSELEKLIGKPGVVIIDPRPPELFEGKTNLWVRNGHIPGAKNIPWPTFTEANNPDEALKNPHQLKSLDAIKKILADRNIKLSDNIIVSCSTGREATLQYVVLKHLLGYPKVRIYEGSWTEYSTTNLPVETGPERAV
ncbi:sulfurtransferase [Synechocystis sp. LKSZ1]|uniref:sulfurtransferase n=1 Tax=Synechocystis sp. LKSZ1 TaxID=3144951 RepID=UPI00336BB22F